LARDLKEAFPDMKGFSARNLKYMRYFAEHCPSLQFGQQAAAQIALDIPVDLVVQLLQQPMKGITQQVMKTGMRLI
jgi:hypothetical protein